MNRSMFTKSDRSVGLGGTDDCCIRLPTDMIVGQKEVNFWVCSSRGMKRGKAGEKDERGRQLKGPISDTNDISNHGGPRLGSTDTDSAFTRPSFSFYTLLSPGSAAPATSVHSATRCHCSCKCHQLDVTNVCACPKIDDFGNVASSSQPAGTPFFGYQDIEDLSSLGYF